MKKRNFPIWTILYKNLIWILLVVIAFGVLSYFYSRKKKNPTYIASEQILVYADIDETAKRSTATANNNATLADLVLSKVISAFKSEEAMAIINSKIEDEYYISKGSIGTDVGETLIFTMSYADVSQDGAEKRLSNAIKGFGWWLDECDKMDIDIISTGTISIKALQKEAEITVSTPYINDAIYGTAIGLLISCVIAILLYIFDNKVRDEKELESLTGAKLIAYVSNKK